MWKGSPGRASRVMLWCGIWLTSKEPTLTNRGWGTREPYLEREADYLERAG
jgi:hypothetical protein